MGWLWGSKNPPSPPSSDTDTDPLRDLDPNLRAFLDSETPPTQPAPPAPSPPPPPTESDTSNSSTSPKVPAESLYPDGRYAHLWSTYRPLQEIKLATQTDQEKLQEVLEGYKDRKTLVARAALENCAMEQSAVDECFKTGGWGSRMTMCRAENRAFNRCYTMQSRFLQALGYLTANRPPAEEEQIQMHADTLYHRMLAQERAAEAAKAADEAVPTFPPLLSSSPAQPPSSSASPSESLPLFSEPTPMAKPERPITEDDSDPLTPSARAALMERIRKLPTAEERELEERAVTMEAWAGMHTSLEVQRVHNTQVSERKERREKGNATVLDAINGWFGF